MNPLALASLFALGPGLISKLFGSDPRAKLRAEIGRLTSPQNVGAVTNQFYNLGLASPAFSQAQGAIAQGANQTSNNVAASLAQRGLGTTGTGAILNSLTPSLVGSQQANLRSTLYQGAQGQAQQQIQALINALLGTQGPSQSTQLFAGGLDALSPLLTLWLKSKYPQMGTA